MEAVDVAVNGDANPLAVTVSPGQCHESTRFEVTMEEVRVPQPAGRPRQRPEALAGDKAYDAEAIRDWLKKRGVKDVIPTKSNEKPRANFDRKAYRRRNVIERCIGWLKECRRIMTRFEKLAVNFVAMFKLAMIRHYLRVLSGRA